MPLTDTAVRNTKPKEKDFKLTDEKGLFLLVKVKVVVFSVGLRKKLPSLPR